MTTPDDDSVFFYVYVGEQTFKTTVQTLCEGTGDGCKYFKDLLESPEGQDMLQAAEDDGTEANWQIELDPEIFALVLSYLRSGVMPLYWNEVQGFDYYKYAKLEWMADFLGIERLRTWIAEKKYLRAVKCTYEVNKVSLEDISQSDDFCRISEGSVYSEAKSSLPWSIALGPHAKCDVHPLGRSGWMGVADEDMAIMTVIKETMVDNRVLFGEDMVDNSDLFDGDDYGLDRLFT